MLPCCFYRPTKAGIVAGDQVCSVRLVKVRAAQDYHVKIDQHFYSVPHQLKGQEFEYCLSSNAIELLFKGKCIAMHTRSFSLGLTTTLDEHRHPAHKAVAQWSEQEAIDWAAEVGANTASLLRIQLSRAPGYLLGYRITQAMKALLKSHGKTRLEEVCAFAIKNKVTGTPELRNILSKKLDQLLNQDAGEDPAAGIAHENIRGAQYYDQLLQVTKENES